VLAVKRGAQSLKEIAAAAQTKELSPSAATGMAIGADIAEADPAVIRTGRMWAKVARSIDVTATASGHDHTGWRRTGCLWVRPALLLTQRAIGLARATYKRFGAALEPGQFRRGWRGLAAPQKLMEQENEKNEEPTGEQLESQVGWHDQSLHSGSR